MITFLKNTPSSLCFIYVLLTIYSQEYDILRGVWSWTDSPLFWDRAGTEPFLAGGTDFIESRATL